MARPQIDVVLAVDTSTPLKEEIVEIETHLQASFWAPLQNTLIDSQLIVVSQRGESSDQVCIPPPLGGESCGDLPPRFHHVDCRFLGPETLSIIGGTYGAINLFTCRGTGPAPWGAYVRFDAYKVFVIVTDDEPFPAPLFFDAATFVNFLVGAAPAGMFGSAVAKKFVVHGIIGADGATPPMKCSGNGHEAKAPGFEYIKLAQATGGLVHSICNPDMPGMLGSIAQAIISRHRCDFVLPRRSNGTAAHPGSVSLFATLDGVGPSSVPFDGDFPCGAGAQGWQFNADESRILLCGDLCEAFATDATARLEAELGCPEGPQ